MSLQSFRISPDQWKEFDTYEGRFNIETMCAENVIILCDNVIIVPSLFEDSLLPEFFTAEERCYPKINKARLTFTGISYLKLRGSLFNPMTGEWTIGSDDKEVSLSHTFGKPGEAKHAYELSGIGRLIWPPMSTADFIIETSDHLTLSFDDGTYFP